MDEASALALVGRPPKGGAWALLCDFDGTITMQDTHEALMEAFVPPARQAELVQRFHAGAASLWELLDESMTATERPWAEVQAELLRKVRLDAGFAPLVAWCRAEGVPVAIVSAGLQELIEAFLGQGGLTGLPVIANRLALRPGERFGLSPLHPGCTTGVDKASVLRGAQKLGWRTAFVGDGVSDRLAAPVADRCYAKAGLARWCGRHGHPHVPFTSLQEVHQDLATLLGTQASL